MSGGAYDYAYLRIEELVRSIAPTTPKRRAFRHHLALVARACKDIERVDSGDSSRGSEDAAIMRCLGSGGNMLVLNEVIADARSVLHELTLAIVDAEESVGRKE